MQYIKVRQQNKNRRKRGSRIRKLVSALLVIALYISIVQVSPASAEPNTNTNTSTTNITQLNSSGDIGDIPIDSTYFPDSYLRTYVEQFSANGLVLTKADREKVEEVKLSGDVTTLTGLEYFTNMKTLEILHSSSLQTLDISKYPSLQNLAVNNYSNLETVKISQNQNLKRIKIGICFKLNTVTIKSNPNLQTLELNNVGVNTVDFSDNTSLATIRLANCLNLTSFDTTNMVSLKTLDLSDCDNLNSINFANNTSLETFECRRLPITSLELGANKNLQNLTIMDCKNLQSVDVTKNTELTEIVLFKLPKTSLKLGENSKVTSFHAREMAMTDLDLSKCPNVEAIDIRDMPSLENLNVSKNTKLKNLICTNVKISTLDVSNNELLETLAIADTDLKSLDVSHNNKLWGLSLENCKATFLDVSNNVELKELYITNTPISYLDLSKNEKIDLFEGDNTSLAYVNFNDKIDPANVTLTGNKNASIYVVGNSFKIDEVLPEVKVDKMTKLNNLKIDTSTGMATIPDIDQPSTYSYDCGKGITIDVTLTVKKLIIGKYGKYQAFDVQRNGVFPKANKAINLWAFRTPLDELGKQISLEKGEYISFVDTGTNVEDLDVATQNKIIKQYKPYATNENAIKKARVVKEVLFDKNNTQIAVVANYGIVWALDDNGFLFTAMNASSYIGGVGTYFTNQGYHYGSSDSYIPDKQTPATKDELDVYIGSDSIKEPTNDKKTQDYHGTIHDEKGNPIINADIIIKDKTGKEVDKVTSDSEGNFTFDDIANGEYEMIVTPKGEEKYPPVDIIIDDKKEDIGFSEETKDIYEETQSNQDVIVEVDKENKKVDVVVIVDGFFLGKYYEHQLFDVLRNPAFPINTQNFYLYNLQASYDGKMKHIAWDRDHEDYVKFYDTGKTVADLPKEQREQILKGLSSTNSTKEAMLKGRVIKQVQFHEDGSVKKVLANYGLVWSLEDEGFLYTAMCEYAPYNNTGGIGTLVTTKPHKNGSSVILQPESNDPIAKIEELSKYDKAPENPEKLSPDSQETQGIGGIITDEEGNIVPDAKVEIKDKEGNTIGTVTTDEEGRWTFNGVEESKVVIVVSKDGKTYPDIVIEVNKQKENAIEIVIEKDKAMDPDDKDEAKPKPTPTPNPDADPKPTPTPDPDVNPKPDAIPTPQPPLPNPMPDLDPTPGAPEVIPEEPTVEVTPENLAKTTDNQTSSPIKTGDTTNIVLPIVIVLVAGMILMVSYGRRKE